MQFHAIYQTDDSADLRSIDVNGADLAEGKRRVAEIAADAGLSGYRLVQLVETTLSFSARRAGG